jgi:hypothetical protein
MRDVMSELPVGAEQPGQTGVLDSLGVGEFWGDRCTSDSSIGQAGRVHSRYGV